jgi:hypothetical protein
MSSGDGWRRAVTSNPVRLSVTVVVDEQFAAYPFALSTFWRAVDELDDECWVEYGRQVAEETSAEGEPAIRG